MTKPFNVTILGAGTGVPLKDRHAPGLVVQGGTTQVLLDSGSGTAYQLAKAGFKYYDFDHLFYSHYTHPDHINDLAELIFANAYFDPPRKRELNVYGPSGMTGFLERLVILYPVLGKVGYAIKTHELEQTQIRVGDLFIASRPLSHLHSAAVGYRVEYQGKSVIYSGDTDYCGELIELSRDGDVLVVECSFPNGHKVQGHLIPEEIGRVARQAGVKKVILTHLYPLCDQFDVVDQVRKTFSGEVVRAKDLMSLRI